MRLGLMGVFVFVFASFCGGCFEQTALAQQATITQVEVDLLKGQISGDSNRSIIQEWFEVLAGIEPEPEPEPEPTPDPDPIPPGMFPVLGLPGNAPVKHYPEPRVYVEWQAWWDQLEGRGSEHIHVGAALPLGQTVRGTIQLDFRIRLHNQPQDGITNWFRGGVKGKELFNIPLEVAPDRHGDADVWLPPIFVDTREVNNGIREWRFSANIPDKYDRKRQFPSCGMYWIVDNDNPLGTSNDFSSTHITEARGWYSDFEYANSSLRTPLPTNPLVTWAPEVRMDDGSGGVGVTSHMATIDPDFHAGNEGIVVKSGRGPYRGPLAIDAGALGLEPGVHRLVLIADQRNADGMNSGVLSVPFVVGE